MEFFLFISLLTSTAVSTQHMLCITGSITLIPVTMRLCANMCVHMCVYVCVSDPHARVLTSRGLRMLAEQRNTQAMSRDVNTLWQRILPSQCCYLLTPWSRVLLEKLTGSAASQEFPRIFGTRRFLTVLTSAPHLSLSWVNSIQSPQPLSTSSRSILILSSHLSLGLPSGLFPSGLPTRTLCTPLPSFQSIQKQ